ncbi:hypothetical protein K6119_05055 [Paracrocinitomix mangrovi]|uniref:hypothetical protein n=1 Tax=Paracrocinitomix mangrovi TaxID=2862509 RepID=UPI001C8E3C66|nr:hypothetical protein [Paracrocinitomix mangrovi]UKN02881.1 hypothetical protein K6119_05055 [Paracrocinitomix mangrovi]
MKRLIAFAAIAFVFVVVKAQTTTNNQNQNNNTQKDSVKLIQMTGIVISDSMERIPYTKVSNMTTRKGVIADFYGYFALVVRPGDTIRFTSLGYKTKTYYVPNETKDEFSLVQILKFDTLTTDPVDVYPWPSKEAFADAFVNMPSPNDDLKRARERLTPQEMAYVGALMESDGLSSYSAYQQQFYQDQYTRGQGPQNNLLNPASWADFLKGIGTGRYRISN